MTPCIGRGSDLATRADTTEAFIPLSDEWRRESVDLSAYYGNEEVMLVFRGKNRFGNNIYIDNINFDARDTTTPPPTNLVDLGQMFSMFIPTQCVKEITFHW